MPDPSSSQFAIRSRYRTMLATDAYNSIGILTSRVKPLIESTGALWSMFEGKEIGILQEKMRSIRKRSQMVCLGNLLRG